MTLLLQHTQTALGVVNLLVVSCGIGLAGIVGGKATEQVRQLMHSDARMQAMDRLSGEIDSMRRRRELATNIDKKDDGLGSPRDWSDVAVDKLYNVVVVEDEVPPTLGSVSDELTRFDSLLIDRYKKQNDDVTNPLPLQPPQPPRPSRSGDHPSEISTGIIKPSDFLLDDEDDEQ